VVARLLAFADDLYLRSEAGISALPMSCRAGIHAARLIYGAIGAEVARAGHDSVTRRARTTGRRKLGLIALAGVRAAASPVMPQSARLHAAPLPEVAFLVTAAARGSQRASRSEALISVLAQLEARDRARRGGQGLAEGLGDPT
jgi:phytoene synthase